MRFFVEVWRSVRSLRSNSFLVMVTKYLRSCKDYITLFSYFKMQAFTSGVWLEFKLVLMLFGSYVYQFLFCVKQIRHFWWCLLYFDCLSGLWCSYSQYSFLAVVSLDFCLFEYALMHEKLWVLSLESNIGIWYLCIYTSCGCCMKNGNILQYIYMHQYMRTCWRKRTTCHLLSQPQSGFIPNIANIDSLI